jgi:deoxyribodipyrimidine photolyase-related protein
MHTIWVFGDQLNRRIGAMRTAEPTTHRILLVHSAAALSSKRWHRQRAHFVVTAMRRFAAELRAEGFQVDLRHSTTLAAGLNDHLAEFTPQTVSATEPNSWNARQMLDRAGVQLIRSNQFLCHYEEFADWAGSRRALKMEDFYRWQRRRLGYLMESEGPDAEPVTGRWNYDEDNRLAPPKGDTAGWTAPILGALDDLDAEVLAGLPDTCWGAEPDGTWATSRAEALARLDQFIDHVLPGFGPHEDAMTTRSWHLSHSLLSPYLNIGLLLPDEVCDRVQQAYDQGLVPINSAEGFIRQVIGWREYVWGVYWLWMPEYRSANQLGAVRPLPPVFSGQARTSMRCVAVSLETLHDHAYAHHIQRLMVLGNLALLTGVDPAQMTEWMWASFIDGAEWVMLPNVIGMSLHADGGRMATKPYAAGGNYIDKMSDYCKDCRYDRKQRTGPDACPFTTLYWDFLARHQDRFVKNPRMARQVRAAQRLDNLPEVQARAAELLDLLDQGAL